MGKHMVFWAVLFTIFLIVGLSFVNLQFGSVARNDPIYVDLQAFPIYIKNGFEPSDAAVSEYSPEDWDLALPPRGGAAIISDLPLPVPESVEQYGRFSTAKRPIEEFTFYIPFELSGEQYDSLYARGFVQPGLYFVGIGENWEIFVNGQTVCEQVFLNENHEITEFHSQRGVTVPFDRQYLKRGENALVIRVVGARSAYWTGLTYDSPYYLGDYGYMKNDINVFSSEIISAICVILGFYHILLFFLRKTDKYNITFSIFAILLGLYLFARSPAVYPFIPDTRYAQRLEYAAMFMLACTLAVFFETLNLGRIGLPTKIYTAFCSILTVLQFFFPIWFAYGLLQIWSLTSPVFFVYVICFDLVYPMVKYVSERREAACRDGAPRGFGRLFFTSMVDTEYGNIFLLIVLVALMAIFDLIDTALFYTGIFLTRYAFLGFLLCMAFILARKYANQYEITEQMNETLDRVVKQRTEQLEEQKLIAETANRSKSGFLAAMSHEIRTPMNAIIGIAQIQLQKSGLPDEYADALEKIYMSGSGLLGIINDILDMSKIETGKMELTPAEYDVPSLINDAVQLNVVRIGAKPIEFTLDIDENLPSRLYGDELRLKQVLSNLLSNAIKYTEKGRVKLSVSHTARGEDVMLRFAVEDTGQGMKPEDRDKLFSEYSRFNAEANRATEGTGLGLSITKRLVEMMDGAIEVESEYGHGSTFTVTLRQKAVACAAIGAALSERLRNFTFTTDRRHEKLQIVREPMPYGTVLVVDDMEINLFVTEGLLSPYGLKVETANSGFAALAEVQNGKTYDVIFMDHMMPGMDGIETTKKIRSLGYRGAVVALTANALVGNDELFRQNGFDGFVSKPIDLRQLNAALNKFVRDRRPEEAKKWRAETSRVPLSKEAEISPKMIQIFCRDAEKAIVTLRETAAKGDIKLFTTTAHAMKSALANVGERAISESAFALEKAGHDGDLEFISANAEGFVRSLETLTEKLRPAGTEAEAAPEDGAAIREDTAYLAEQLRIIQSACERYDDEAAYAALDRLDEKAWKAETAAALGQIRDTLFLHSDFDGAAELALKLRS